jgi:transposase
LELPNDIRELQQLVSNLIERITALENEVKELKDENTALRIENSNLKKENILLKTENSELKARLNQNSNNSSKPPSSDFFNRKPAFPKVSKGKKGGQQGHKGNTLNQIKNPDKIVECRPDNCDCGHKFKNEEVFVTEKRQLFDLPQPKLEVTEYQIFGGACPICGKTHKGTSPSNVNSPVQYGNGVRAYLTMLSTTYKLPYKKIQQLFQDLFGYPINESTIYSANKRCYQELSESEKEILENLLKEQVVHADETGIKIEKDNYWLHILSSNLYTYQFAHEKRGKEALSSESSIIDKLTNWLVHDCWSSYFSVKNTKHSLCCAHLLRELQGVIDNNKNNKWAKDLQSLLLETNKMSFEKRIENRKNLEKRFESICSLGDNTEPIPIKIPGKKGKRKKTKARNLIERLIKHKDAVLAFAFNEEVPFTNNLAERDLRPVKLKLKISNCFRSFEGAKIYARIESFVSTARKNNKNVFSELKNTFEGQNFLTLQGT